MTTLFALDPESASNDDLTNAVNLRMTEVVAGIKGATEVNLLFLYDSSSIASPDTNRIYRAASTFPTPRPILLILHSLGGDAASAYFIGKLGREFAQPTLEVAVPRQAKSAATLICCAADRLHLGSLSELGPIDPQIAQMPALAVKHSVEHLAELVTAFPAAQKMISEYLVQCLPIQVIGYFERAARSAVQYAERLLGARTAVPKDDARNAEIARRLVYEYKDHGFAIDASEAESIFGNSVVVRNSPRYQMASELYTELDFLEWFIRNRFRRAFSFTGSAVGGAWVRTPRD